MSGGGRCACVPSYSKMDDTTSSMPRCTSWSSVRALAGAAGGDALVDQPAGVDEETRAHPLRQAVLLEVAHLLAQLRQVVGDSLRDPCLVADDARLLVPWRVTELNGHETLAGAVLQVLESALVSGVVGDHKQEAFHRLDDLPELLNRQHAPVVRQRVDQNGRVLARFD